MNPGPFIGGALIGLGLLLTAWRFGFKYLKDVPSVFGWDPDPEHRRRTEESAVRAQNRVYETTRYLWIPGVALVVVGVIIAMAA